VSTPQRKATYQDVLDAPEHKVAEILDGELFLSPRPATPHANAGSAIGADLNSAFHRPPGDPKQPGGWWILDEPELHLGTDVVVPDLAGWRHERMPILRDMPAFTMPPDWVCEIVSPSTGYLDRGRKMRIYAHAGVPHLWIVDPIIRTLEVYGLEGRRWIVASTHGGIDPVRAVPFDAIELEMARWWLPPAPEEADRR
jgi:Uma2 family endonuclease